MKRLAAVVMVGLLSVSLSQIPVFADQSAACAPGQSQDDGSIASLERQFFEQTFSSESKKDRLDRLDKLVFGEIKQGSDQSRLTELLNAVKPPATPNPISSTGCANPASNPPEQEHESGWNIPQTTTSGCSTQMPYAAPSIASATPTAAVPSNAAAPSIAGATPVNQAGYAGTTPQVAPTSAPGVVPENDDYPRITALEQELLGKTHQNWNIHKRLDTLEQRAFHQEYPKDDLSDRVTNLESYAQQKGLQRPGSDPEVGAAPQQDGATPAVAASLPYYSTPMLAKVAWLEQEEYGAADAQLPTAERVSRLDSTVFPQDAALSAEALPENVDTLVNAVEFNKGLPQTVVLPSAQAAPATATDPNKQYQYGQPGRTATQPGQPVKKGHPLLRGLAHVAGIVGQMALSNIGGGYGGMGGYGSGYCFPGFGF